MRTTFKLKSIDYVVLTALSFAFQFSGWQHDLAWVNQIELQLAGIGFGALLTFLYPSCAENPVL